MSENSAGIVCCGGTAQGAHEEQFWGHFVSLVASGAAVGTAPWQQGHNMALRYTKKRCCGWELRQQRGPAARLRAGVPRAHGA